MFLNYVVFSKSLKIYIQPPRFKNRSAATIRYVKYFLQTHRLRITGQDGFYLKIVFFIPLRFR